MTGAAVGCGLAAVPAAGIAASAGIAFPTGSAAVCVCSDDPPGIPGILPPGINPRPALSVVEQPSIAADETMVHIAIQPLIVRIQSCMIVNIPLNYRW